MTDTGTCSNRYTNCKANHFCPAINHNTVACIPCSEDMKLGQGCYCKDNKVSINCKECNGTSCSICLPGSFLNGTICTKCPKGCDECTESNSCQKYAAGVTMENAKLASVCATNEDCDDHVSTFCDMSTKKCAPCGQHCTICSSATVCNSCDLKTHITTIHGTCTPKCKDIEDGNYCKDGVPTPCGEGIDSPCSCRYASNCASCNSSLNGCETCLPNVIKEEDGRCRNCASGFKPIGSMCWSDTPVPTPPSPDPPGPDPEVNTQNLSSGAVAGIVIGVLLVVGAVGGGLTYYFVRRAKK
ncbi:Cysteine-rich membrane protein 1 [Spironucleus salmonicida]|uniref:Cysteine-rich membrane protein 1 n=1 Tax=Spironucleus salmonicida TaxID=348837 RepID=V6LAR0_9EUKA|nr:Cysteine-rich membrane protein 1 [Spironucleus salmonicida]|eukprot:EST41545.1 Cysteine-rich membrane protein 1 [Spironucleus salmonicida]